MYIELNLFCDAGETNATVKAKEGDSLVDNVLTEVTAICPGCKTWTNEKLGQVREEIRQEAQSRHGRSYTGTAGLLNPSEPVLNQFWMDSKRIGAEGPRRLINGMCTPIKLYPLTEE